MIKLLATSENVFDTYPDVLTEISSIISSAVNIEHNRSQKMNHLKTKNYKLSCFSSNVFSCGNIS